MKIAITSQGAELSSEVDPRFGRAQCFVVYDLDTDDLEAVDNDQNLNASQGAGIQAAQNVASQDVEAVLTGHCGPNAFKTLDSAGIKVVVGVTGTVQEAIDAFKAGELKPTDHADVEGHWM